MTFDTTLTVADRVATVTWAGELDSHAAPDAQADIARAAENDLDQLVVVMTDLEYLSSAGLRCLVFAHQKLSRGIEIVLVGAREEVAETIRMTGFHQSVTMVDEAATS